jgi:flagellar protein FlgJ
MEHISGSSGIIQGHGAARPLSAADGAVPASDPRKAQATKKVAREFEALFIGMMLKSMRETVGKDGLTGGGRGEEVYGSLLDQEYANSMAQHGGIGLASMIEQQLNGPLLARVPSRDTASHDSAYQRSENEVNHENR